MAGTMTFNQNLVVTGTANTPVYYDLDLTENGKLVLQTSGISALVGIWGPFPAGVTPVDAPPYGLLRVCGANAWGTRTFTPGTYLVRVTPNADGAVTLLLRTWSFWDYFTIGLHASSC